MGHLWSQSPIAGGIASIFQGANNVNISGGTFVALQGSGNVQIHRLSTTNDIETARELLKELPPNNFRLIHDDNFDKRVPGSGIWFIESKILQDWMHGRSIGHILWVIGNAGVGKTVLASTVIAELENFECQSSENGPGTAIAYIYCRYTEKMTVADLLTALVRQQLERHPALAPLIKPFFDKYRQESRRPSHQALVDLLNAISREFKTTYYVLDALDEAPHDLRFDIVQALASVNAKFFITSRPLGLLERKFADFTTFTTLVAHQTDIDLLIDHAIARDPYLEELLQEEALRSEVRSTIFKNCGGMFLHASLQLKALSLSSNIDDVRHTLSAFPREINGFYDQCFERMDRQSERQVLLAKRALTCILSAKRDLTLEELQVAISYNPESRRFGAITSADHLLPLFCGLVTVDAESKLVRLVHYTAFDTVRKHLQHDSLHADLHAHLASACIAYLNKNGFQHFDLRSNVNDVLNSDPFLHYAHQNWHIHAHQSSSKSVEEFCTDFILQCKSFPFYGVRWRGIHLAARYNFVNPMRHLAKLAAEVNQADGDGRTGLMHAAWNGHEACVRLLVDAEGIEVNLADDDGWTALIKAAVNGSEDCLRLLLEAEGIAVNQVDSNGRSALMHAAWNGHERCLCLLLAAEGIAVNLSNNDGRMALIYAVWNGHEACVRLLLDAEGISVNLADNDGWTALIYAAQNGEEDCVRLLLDVEGIAVNLADNNGWTALIHAAAEGSKDCLRLLLDVEDVVVNQVDDNGWTALIHATQNSHEACIVLLNAKSPTSPRSSLAISLRSIESVGSPHNIIQRDPSRPHCPRGLLRPTLS